ncbi:hypothetical protein KHC23_01805 [Ancylobacter dichloromethanicus]|uniref:Secreted protein n=1 Tax=Ancylobacter dichloromethanicus TaxID=518825 RepID=A0A9W6JE92_9HYPH|nr:hypothetical protein [Ancylobacter dichloromethanicus]MBS7552395.1 hypothetical protein [Ancylobacter dichloromethanicus]GLK74134.1 hypothetical protein GCM10017643_42520 [Ancylobacter dichloromethanicus]
MKYSIFAVVMAGCLSVGAMGSAKADDACLAAGRLTQAVGSVMVDRGNGFVPGVIGTSLRGGDKIAVRGQGRAVVDFGDDRTLMVPASTTETIRVPGCGMLQTNASGISPTVGTFGMLAIAGATAAAISTTDSKSGTVFFPVSP